MPVTSMPAAGPFETRTTRLDHMSNDEIAGLADALGIPETAFWAEETQAGPAGYLGGSVRRKQLGSLLLSPPVAGPQEILCRRWIEQRLSFTFDPNIPLCSHLQSGHILCKLLGENAHISLSHTRIAWRMCENNVRQFLRRAIREGLTADEIFDVDDLLLRKNIPRVLRTIGSVARKIDPDNFANIVAEVPGASMQWGEDDELDESWQGDGLLSSIVTTFKRVSGRRRMTIAVLGTSGSGKSATANLLVGRPAKIEGHNFCLDPNEKTVCPQLRSRMRKVRRVLAKIWPHQLFENGPHPGSSVTKSYVKIAGVTVSVIELPSAEVFTTASDADGTYVTTQQAGSLEGIRAGLEKEQVDIILLVERLDEYRSRDLKLIYHRINNLFGSAGWDRTIAVMTHGYSLPPADLSFEEHIRRRSHLIQENMHKICGNQGYFLPIVVVENSSKCPVDETSSETEPNTNKILPDGTRFLREFEDAVKTVVTRLRGTEPVQPAKTRPWWEAWAVGIGVLWLLNQL